MQAHLSKLYHHDYLRRYGAKNKVFYTLGLRAIEPLVVHFDADPARARRLLGRVHEPAKFYFPHSRLVCQVHVMTELALRQTDAAIGFWRHDGEIETDVTFVDARQKTKRVPIIPDAYVAIETGAGERAHLCLEADRATMTHERFTNKMQGYYRFWRRPAKRPARCEAVLGVSHFRVLVVCPSIIRLEGLYTSTRAALTRDPVYSRALGEAKKDGVDAPSGIAFVHTDEFQDENGGYVFPDVERRFIPFL